MTEKCVSCREDMTLPFEFKMAFQPIVDVEAHAVWGYEALVRGANGKSAHSVLSQLSPETRLIRSGGTCDGHRNCRRAV